MNDDFHDVYKRRLARFSIEPKSTAERKKMIVKEIVDEETWDEWLKNDNLIVSKIFSWLWKEIELDEIYENDVDAKIQEEFDMYFHHQIERNDQSNKKWLRTMFFSLTQ